MISTTSGESSIQIWQRDQPDYVWISVERRTEALFGPAAFLGFEISDESIFDTVDLKGK